MQIIAFCGRKQSGKDTAFKIIKEYVPDAKSYAFADPLKRMCIDILGLKSEQVYGTDEEKNTIVPHLRWENFPVLSLASVKGDIGPMTGREVMQYWGTEIFRRQYTDVWAHACIRQIKKDNPPLAVILDGRFPNEVFATKDEDGLAIKLTRIVFPNDNHASETALDSENFDQSHFNAIVDNQNMSLKEYQRQLPHVLYELGVKI